MKNVLIKGVPSVKGEADIKVNKTLKPVEREDSNLEAELGEFIVTDTMATGFPETYVVGGSRHSSGGTPLNLPDNSFVFSRDKSMAIKNEEIQEEFNKPFRKKGWLPADIAKKYDINEYRKVLADPNSDKIQRETAEDMIKNYNEKLGKLALVQESMKGFDSGIPFISIPYLESMGIDPANLVNNGNPDEAEVADSDEEEIPEKKMGGEMKIKITGLPKLQKGGQKEPIYSKTQLANMQKLKALGYNVGVPETVNDVKGAVDKIQKKLGDVYGRKDWSSPELFPDFAKRASWYLKDNPNFDPKKEKDVAAFQQAYNDKLVGMGLDPELAVDKKFGERTYSIYDLNKPEVKQPSFIPSPNMQTAPADLNFQGNINEVQANQNTPFWTQDVINTAGAFGDLQRLKKYMPWQASPNTILPEATYYDPTRELAANAEQANISAQALGAFSGPQQLSSRLSSVQGQGLANAANILGKYNNLNVGIANQNNATQTDIINQANANKANAATALYDKTISVNDKFDNATRALRGNLRQSFVNAWTNRGKTQSLNAMNKQYNVDPLTGFTEFTGVPGQLDKTAATNQAINQYNEIRNRPGMTDENAIKLFEALYKSK